MQPANKASNRRPTTTATMMMMSLLREERPLEGAEMAVGDEVDDVSEAEVGVAELDAGKDVEEDGPDGAFVWMTPATDCTALMKESRGFEVVVCAVEPAAKTTASKADVII